MITTACSSPPPAITCCSTGTTSSSSAKNSKKASSASTAFKRPSKTTSTPRTPTSITCRPCSPPWPPSSQEIKTHEKIVESQPALPSFFHSRSASQTPTMTPQYKDIVDAVFASGSTQAKEQYRITAYADGYLQQSFVAEDDSVRKGQLLFRIANDLQRTQVANAATNYEYALRNASDKEPPDPPARIPDRPGPTKKDHQLPEFRKIPTPPALPRRRPGRLR